MRVLALVAIVVLLAGCASTPAKTSTTTTTPVVDATDLPNGTQLVTVETAKGSFTFRLAPDLAPKTTAHIADLVAKKFYDGIPFHRWEEGFVLQGGDPLCKGDGWKNARASGCGSGGSGQDVPGEFGGKHDQGAVGLAGGKTVRAGPVTVLRPYVEGGSKFFVAKVNLKEQAKLGFQYLRPLQVAYESPKFMLPIRLGMVNADGPQELVHDEAHQPTGNDDHLAYGPAGEIRGQAVPPKPAPINRAANANTIAS